MGELGYFAPKYKKKEFTQSKAEIENEIKICLAGAVAEEVFRGYHKNGNTSDLKTATCYAKQMVTQYGMSELGLAQIDDSAGMGRAIYDEINKILDKCQKETIELIKQNRSKMEKAITYLLEHKEMTEEDFIDCIKE